MLYVHTIEERYFEIRIRLLHSKFASYTIVYTHNLYDVEKISRSDIYFRMRCACRSFRKQDCLFQFQIHIRMRNMMWQLCCSSCSASVTTSLKLHRIGIGHSFSTTRKHRMYVGLKYLYEQMVQLLRASLLGWVCCIGIFNADRLA